MAKQYGFYIDSKVCSGCKTCLMACKDKHDLEVGRKFRRVYEITGGDWLEDGDAWIPNVYAYNLSISCNHCDNPVCVKACPTGAHHKREDGVVDIHAEQCIGCRYCEAACPYWARRFNFTKPSYPEPKENLNPQMEYLSNRPRSQGVMEKCHFCMHRTRQGQLPACLEVCPVGARKFGNLLDPQSEVSQVLNNKHVFVLKQEVGTMPRFFYYFDQEYPRSKRASDGGLADEGATPQSGGGDEAMA